MLSSWPFIAAKCTGVRSDRSRMCTSAPQARESSIRCRFPSTLDCCNIAFKLTRSSKGGFHPSAAVCASWSPSLVASPTRLRPRRSKKLLRPSECLSRDSVSCGNRLLVGLSFAKMPTWVCDQNRSDHRVQPVVLPRFFDVQD